MVVGHGRFPRRPHRFYVPVYVTTTVPVDYSDSVDEVSSSLDTTDAVVVPSSSEVLESVTTADTVTATVIFSASVSESVTTTDTPSALALFTSAISETTSSSDTTSAVAIFPRTISESVTTSDSQSVSSVAVATVSEVTTSLDSTDASLGGVVYNISVSEVLVLSDSFIAEDSIQTGGRRWQDETKYSPPKTVSVKSSDIDSVSYDKRANQLTVNFKNNTSYSYSDVGEHQVKNLKKAKSPGGYLHNNLKGKHFVSRIK